ncbi:hypothetical protein B0T26DRAFT_270168 [Lasiosphaeria miniovina]|uniref:Uncharacterized protein n=1 Tax=Lasiosphaeria miniovina TaxID=1954250 RepID=A0AA40AJH8_9PEZI|nr:uncharacterized protein B0T26DRAFT_270168 [Lasiosphaeria miniovina]KAK0716920.1 hypothetical protein B0T26DRAFT_270168 [Lasiosphaeria miniovina]
MRKKASWGKTRGASLFYGMMTLNFMDPCIITGWQGLFCHFTLSVFCTPVLGLGIGLITGISGKRRDGILGCLGVYGFVRTRHCPDHKIEFVSCVSGLQLPARL